MLDAFLEVACGHIKQAEARDRDVELLGRLPVETLMKVASGELLKEACGLGMESGDWLEKFRGTPLLDQAIALEKQDLELQMQDQQAQQHRRQMEAELPRWDESQAARDHLRIQRKLLELELVGGPSAAAAPAAEEAVEEVAEAPAGLEEAAEVAAPPEPNPEAPPAKPPTTKVVKETTEKPQEEKVDIKQAAARMRFSLIVKEAGLGGEIMQGIKGMGQFAGSAVKGVTAAGRAGGFAAAKDTALSVGKQGLQRAGRFIAQNPGAGAAMIAAPALAGGYMASKTGSALDASEAQPASRARAFRR